MTKRKGSGGYADEHWFKLARRIFRSSVWEEDPASRIVWITLLHLAQLPENRKHGHGTVLITRGNLCREAFVTAEQLDHALARFTAPDPTSRTNPGEPRLRVTPNGYFIPSFELYHDADEFDAWYAQRVAAGKARAEKALRSAEASGKGGQGRFTSDKPATAGNEPASSLVSTRKTETLTLTNNNGNGRGASPRPSPASSTSKRTRTAVVPPETLESIQKFDTVFARALGRRASLAPAHYADFAARLAAGFPAEFLIGLPVGWLATSSPDAERVRAVRPDFLLRDGTRAYRRGDEVRPTFDWIGAVWSGLDGCKVTPEQAGLLREVGVFDWWTSRGVKVAEAREARTW